MSAADDETLAAAVSLADAIPAQPAAPEAPAAPEEVVPKRSRRSGSRTPRAPRAAKPERTPRSRTPAAPKLAPRIEGLHELVGGGLAVGAMLGKIPSPVGAFGQSLVDDAEQFGLAWEAYAKANPRVRDALERLLAVSEAGVLLSLYVKAGVRAYTSSATDGIDMAAMATFMAGAVPEQPAA